MAERGFTPVSIHPVFSAKSLSAGDSGTSAAIDLRYTAQQQKFALHTSVALGTAGTAGTTIFKYMCSNKLDGTYTIPSAAGTFGTAGTGIGDDFISFSPILTPFIKIVATQTGAGSSGHDSKISANLFVQ